jgi:tetratricopeptide (TPR) repeat protein
VGIDRTDWLEADQLNEQGRLRADAGDWDGALSWYRQAADRVSAFEPAWFNMALVYKQRRQWDQAMDCNERAAALGGAQGDPAWWNLGIAATAFAALGCREERLAAVRHPGPRWYR